VQLASLTIVLVTACTRDKVSFSGPYPPPRDITSQQDLSLELANLRVFWWKGEGAEEQGYFMNLDGSNPIVAPLGCTLPSPSERYSICLPDLGVSKLELLDLESGQRRVLVQKGDDFPDEVQFGNPSFTPDEKAVIFDVAWSDHINLAIIEIDSGDLEILNISGLMNIEPHVSSDGRLILLSCEGRKLGAGFVLCLFDRETRTREYLVDKAINVIPGSQFTPDGLSVVYTAPIDSVLGEARLYRVDLEDKSSHILVSGLTTGATVRGTTLEDVVFSCRFPDRPACSWLCVVGLDGSDVRRLTYLGDHCIDVNGQ
jgi:hypothetical protein